jgi:uncharacterized glyoxalase superfamily protein PhnB
MTINAATPNIFPVLRYEDAPAAIDWLVRAFGFTRRELFPDADGGVAHAEIDLGSDVIGISSARGPVAGNPWTTVDQGVYIRVNDVDAHYARARAAGGAIACPLRATDYGTNEYTIRDDEGHLWGFGTYGMGASAGESRVFPDVHYRDGAGALDWLRRVAGFELTMEVAGPEASIAHAELWLPPGVVMVGSGPRDARVWGGRDHCVYVFEPGPDVHAARASAEGAVIVRPLEDTRYGSRTYSAHDPEGFLWSFGTYRPRPAALTGKEGRDLQPAS